MCQEAERELGLESRWPTSRDNPDCRDASLWHSLNATTTEVEVSELIASFVRALQPELVVETGSYIGTTSEMIGKALQRNGHGRLVTLETDVRCFRKARRRCRGLPVQVLHKSSLEWFPENDQTIDFMLFDTHFKSREKEYDWYQDFFGKYTVLCWHDSGPHFKRPIRGLIEQLTDMGDIQPIFLPTPRGVCFARVLR